MKTKQEIIQKLLDERHISAEDAMVLLQTEKQIEFVPFERQSVQPVFIPQQPLSPYPSLPRYPWGDFIVTC